MFDSDGDGVAEDGATTIEEGMDCCVYVFVAVGVMLCGAGADVVDGAAADVGCGVVTCVEGAADVDAWVVAGAWLVGADDAAGDAELLSTLGAAVEGLLEGATELGAEEEIAADPDVAG